MNNDDAPINHTDQRIEAVNFDAPVFGGQTETDSKQIPGANPSLLTGVDGAPWWQSQFNLMLCVFGLLALAALLFVLIAPPPELEIAETATSASSTSASVSDNGSAPWDENRRAQARADSQAILSNLLDSKKSLENKGVQNWAPDRFAHALEYAQSGDDFYKQQNFAQAITRYQTAVDELDSLHELIPDLVQRKIDEGEQALRDGKSELAVNAYSRALELEPTNLAATTGLGRANNLDQVLQLLQAAATDQQLFEQEDDLAHLLAAKQTLEQAQGIDSYYKKTRSALDHIETQIADKQYRVAMSEGFAALFSNQFSRANKAFANALKIKPDNQMASSAYKQSLASNKTSSLQSLLNSARRFEKNEDWQNALSNYQIVLQRDPNQVAARLGEIRSKARSQLDAQLRKVLANTLALSKSNKKSEARRVLADAQSINSKGAKLSRQIADVERALQQADVSLKVQFLSDGLTDVTLERSGARKLQLGKFNSKNIALKPGRYVISGVRIGFQDVRKEFDLVPQANGVQQFDVRCDKPIGAISETLSRAAGSG